MPLRLRPSHLLTVALLAGAACHCGCATDAAPTAPAAPAARPTKSLAAKANTGDKDGYVVAIAPRTVRSVTASIGPGGGELITVPPGALTTTESITMAVEGDLRPGLTFAPWATLYLHLGRERVDVDPSGLQAVHILADGSQVVVDSQLNTTGNSDDWQIWVDVPGFSRYGLR